MSVEQLQGAVELVELVLCAWVAVLLVRRLRAVRSTATTSALGVFVVVAVVLLAGQWQPQEGPQGWAALAVDLQVCLLLSLSWLLVRLAHALDGVRRRVWLAMSWLFAAEVVLTVALPPLPLPGEPQAGWVQAYVVFVLAAWSVQSVVACRGLWRAGSGESAVVRQRMRLLATGAVVLAVALVVVAAAGERPGLQVVSALVGLLSIGLFALAFLLPGWLRLVLRRHDLALLESGEQRLMTAVDRDEVAQTVVPLVPRVLGGGGAGLLGPDGEVLLATGWGPAEQERVSSLLRTGMRGDPAAGVLVAPVGPGWLVAQAGRLAPVFGDDELVLLSRIGRMVDLTLQRVALFEQERASRRAAEQAQAELETLLYSVSHDLRSPLISVLGYLDVLREEHGEQLRGEGSHYLERMGVNALYMQNLISDLLELSRIGRNDGPARLLDLGALADSVLQGALLQHPQASLSVEGSLPPVLLNDVRARQLLTNLVDNALAHAGRSDVSVVVRSERAPDGSLLLCVADDGRGIPPEYRARVVQVFERLDAPKSTPGTGMGLAICRRIAESAGGSLRVEGPSGDRATGTTIVVALPAALRLPEQREATATAAARTMTED